MVNSLLGHVPAQVLYRLDVNFNIEETNIDSMIGRTAHILFLENEDLMRMIVARYKVIFSWIKSKQELTSNCYLKIENARDLTIIWINQFHNQQAF